MQIGYARVSTPVQSLALQLDALRKAVCRKVYEEVISGARGERPVLQDMLTHLRAGDVLMLWKLDRLGRSLRPLIEVVTDLAQRGIGFKRLQEHLETTTSSGTLVLHMSEALAECERDLMRERTYAGLVATRVRGRLGGRPRGLSAQAEATALAAETLYREGQRRVRQMAVQCPRGSLGALCRLSRVWGVGARPSTRSTTARLVPGRLRTQRCTHASAVAPALYAPSGVGAMACAGDGGRLRSSCGNEATR